MLNLGLNFLNFPDGESKYVVQGLCYQKILGCIDDKGLFCLPYGFCKNVRSGHVSSWMFCHKDHIDILFDCYEW